MGLSGGKAANPREPQSPPYTAGMPQSGRLILWSTSCRVGSGRGVGAHHFGFLITILRIKPSVPEETPRSRTQSLILLLGLVAQRAQITTDVKGANPLASGDNNNTRIENWVSELGASLARLVQLRLPHPRHPRADG